MKIVLFMNCHGLELKNYFDNFILDNIETTLIFTYQCINEFTDKNIPEYIKKIFSDADILFYNPVSEKHDVWSSNNILSLVPSNCKCYQIPYYKFYGYFYNDETRDNESKFGTLVSEKLEKKLIKLYKLDQNLNMECIKKICYHLINIFNYDYIQSKILQIKNDFNNFRELEQNCQFKMSDYLISNFKNKKLFYNYNHPSSEFWMTLFKMIVNKLNLPVKYVFELKSVMKNLIEEPIIYDNKIAGWLEFDINKKITFNNSEINPFTYYIIHFYSKYINDKSSFYEIIDLINQNK
jgi:hypothetical protein